MRLKFCLIGLALTLAATAQVSRLAENVHYDVELSAQTSNGDQAPFWFVAGRYGLSSAKSSSGYLRAAVGRDIAADSLRKWKIGYGLDVAGGVDMPASFFINQLYGDFQYKALRLSVGAKRRVDELTNPLLSTGGLAEGVNAPAVPQVRLELPDFWVIPGTRNWLAIKGHFAYGAFTDGGWKEDHHGAGVTYTKGVLYHSKAGYLRVGNEEKFPLTFVGGLQMKAQFAGKRYLADGTVKKLPSGLNAFWHAFIPGGSDYSDGDYPNVEGNQLGAWNFQLNWKGKGWGVRAYAQHYFEDHSQMFLEYGWKDMLWGLEARLPKNPVVKTVVLEYLYTMDQTGPIYHDHTNSFTAQISGTDNYYNHGIYNGWHHWGQSMGNALFVSPVFNADGSLGYKHNRLKAYHLGLQGQPTDEIDYRALFTFSRSVGTYAAPLLNPEYGRNMLLEVNYRPKRLGGFAFGAAFASTGGTLTKASTGYCLTISKSGLF